MVWGALPLKLGDGCWTGCWYQRLYVLGPLFWLLYSCLVSYTVLRDLFLCLGPQEDYKRVNCFTGIVACVTVDSNHTEKKTPDILANTRNLIKTFLNSSLPRMYVLYFETIAIPNLKGLP